MALGCIMDRKLRYAAGIVALACLTGGVGTSYAQESFFQKFIRAGAPPPVKTVPPEPSIRYQPAAPVSALPSVQRRRAMAAREAQEVPIKAKAEASTAILVIGDALADKLAEGIDREFADNPDVQLIRKTKSVSGLTRVDVFDWIEAARTAINGPQRIDIAVVLIGINDWQPMQNGGTTLDPGSDAWRDAYGKRVDALIATFKQKNLPLVWVGLPVMRLPKLSEQLESLNALVRDRVKAQGEVFVDLHEAFLGEDGKYSDTGPALNGATVKLRTPDGVSLTQAGALKAAYFADVEVKRILAERPVTPPPVITSPAQTAVAPIVPASPSASLPASPAPGDVERLIDQMAGPLLPADAVPVIARLPDRPIAGPILSLTAPDRSADGLLVSPAPNGNQPVSASFGGGPLRAAKPGRADDFTWRAAP
jgi:hypothetical protein